MTKENAKNKYEELFPDDKSKAIAFDKIAEKYYFSNFGTTSKTDFETLMFSIYIEQLLDDNQKDFNAYSDYTLSKALGITQTKVSSLKERKELLYPYERFDWRESFSRILNRVVYEDGKIKIYIPDRNLYLEIKNAIETMGGYVEVQLTKNLLQVRLPYLLDLLVLVADDNDKDIVKKDFIKMLKQRGVEVDIEENDSIGRSLLNETPELIMNIIEAFIDKGVSGVGITIAKKIIDVVKKKI